MVYLPLKGSKSKKTAKFGRQIVHNTESPNVIVFKNALALPEPTVIY